MRKLTITALVLTLLAALTPLGRTDTARLSIVHVDVAGLDDSTIAYLMTHFDETHNHSADHIELLLWPGDMAELDAMGVDYDVEIADLVAHDLALADAPHPVQVLPGPDLEDYRRLPDYNAEMEEIAKKNPAIVRHFKMPRQSLEGRDIFGLEIAANVKRADGRPIFYMDAVHHAREWPAAEFTMMYAHYLTEKFGKDPKITKLLKKARVILVPIVNVDGFNYSRESVTAVNRDVDEAGEIGLALGNGTESYWRKNRRSLTGVTVPEAQTNPDAYGVDPNRNYAYLWGDTMGGSSSDYHSQTYRGEAPFSEPEPSNVRDIVLSRSVTGVITNHTVQASVLRAGGGNAPDDNLLEPIGARMAKILKFKNAPTVGYPTTGTTDDWAYAGVGALGFTIEHGGSGFHCTYSECVGTPADRTMKAFDIMFDVSANPKYHSVLTGKVAGGNAKLTLSKTFKTPLSEGNPLGEKFVVEKLKMSIPTKSNGSFVWHVGQSDRPYEKGHESYTLTITAGGKTKTMKVHVNRGQKLNLGTIKL
ncbi:MAG TPA: M14 family metallopeptidase [Actinomycetota bacterium]|jgi:hypothetical protein